MTNIIIRAMQIKTTVIYHFTFIRITIIKRDTQKEFRILIAKKKKETHNNKWWKGCEETGTSYW